MAFEYPLGIGVEFLDTLAPGSLWARYLLGSIVLLYAIWTDLTARRVSNRVWLVTLGLGALLGAYDLILGTPPTIFFILVPVIMALAYLMWRLRLLFGGADAKCIMAFALLAPYPPLLAAGDGTLWPHLIAFLPVAVTMLTNAVAFTILIPFGYFLLNLLRGNLHPLAMWLGRRVPLEQVFTEPVWVMEWVRPAPGAADDVAEGPALAETSEDPDLDDDGLPRIDPETLIGATVRLHYMPTRAGDYALNVARLRALGIEEVWVTPKIPFMVPLFFGWLATWLVGDLILHAVFWASGTT